MVFQKLSATQKIIFFSVSLEKLFKRSFVNKLIGKSALVISLLSNPSFQINVIFFGSDYWPY